VELILWRGGGARTTNTAHELAGVGWGSAPTHENRWGGALNEAHELGILTREFLGGGRGPELGVRRRSVFLELRRRWELSPRDESNWSRTDGCGGACKCHDGLGLARRCPSGVAVMVDET
jgi:hypothetical protein